MSDRCATLHRMRRPVEAVHELVHGIDPFDELEADQRTITYSCEGSSQIYEGSNQVQRMVRRAPC
jgi:hypothetical protein